ncbi:hypothetical protein HK096_000437, partial [Nowakowskiella sp. JEL0078]
LVLCWPQGMMETSEISRKLSESKRKFTEKTDDESQKRKLLKKLSQLAEKPETLATGQMEVDKIKLSPEKTPKRALQQLTPSSLAEFKISNFSQFPVERLLTTETQFTNENPSVPETTNIFDVAQSATVNSFMRETPKKYGENLSQTKKGSSEIFSLSPIPPVGYITGPGGYPSFPGPPYLAGPPYPTPFSGSPYPVALPNHYNSHLFELFNSRSEALDNQSRINNSSTSNQQLPEVNPPVRFYPDYFGKYTKGIQTLPPAENQIFQEDF